MAEKIGRSNNDDWIVYVLLIMLAGIALIWHYLPERISSFFNVSVGKTTSRSTENASNTPGFLISFFFFLNYLIAFSLFVFLMIKWISPYAAINYSDKYILTYVAIFVFFFYLFRLLYIRFVGFLFKTKSQAVDQQMVYINSDNALGVLLIPVMFLILFVRLDFFIIFGAIIIITTYAFRWFQIFILGKSISGFSLLHLFLYLCTLEIIPLLVLIKLLEKGVV